jgi:hypothetical protein
MELQESTILMHNGLLCELCFEDAFVIVVGVCPSFFDLWRDSCIRKLPLTCKTLDEQFEILLFNYFESGVVYENLH